MLLISIARDELDDILDGFVWGAMVGIGFLLVEDVFYFVRAFGETGSIGPVFQMFLIRILGAGPYSHFLYTGLVGMGIAYWYVRHDVSTARRALVGAGLVLAGWGAHFFWNSPVLVNLLGDGSDIGSWVVFVTAKGLPMLIGLAIVVHLARKREERWFAGLAAARRRRRDHRGGAAAQPASVRDGACARRPVARGARRASGFVGRSSARSWSSR